MKDEASRELDGHRLEVDQNKSQTGNFSRTFRSYTLRLIHRFHPAIRDRILLMSKRQRESDTMESGPSTLAAETGMSEQELLRLIPQVCRLHPISTHS